MGNLIEPLRDVREILLTGAGGVIGQGIYRYLCKVRADYDLDFRVTLSSKSPWFSNFLPVNQRDQLRLGDLRELGEVLADSYDYIFHFAGYGQPARFQAEPMETMFINSEAVLTLRKKATKGFLYASSSELYSGIDEAQIDESRVGTTTTTHPRAPYIVSKQFGEVATLSSSLGADGSLGKVARIALAYGPGARLDDTRVLNQLITRGLLTGEVRLMDQGASLRTYCYVDDAVEMLAAIMFSDVQGVYNVGGISTTSIRELGELVAHQLEVPFFTSTAENLADSSPKNVNLNISRALELHPKASFVPLEEGVSQVIEWYRMLIGPKQS